MRTLRVVHIVIPVFNEGRTLLRCLERVVRAPLVGGGWRMADGGWGRWHRPVACAQVGRLRHRAGREPQALGRRLYLVDDASTDGTGDILFDLTEEHIVLHHEVNRGKGAALRTGFAAVLERGEDDDIVLIQDADLEYDPADYPRLLEPIVAGRARVVFGTRFGPHYEPRDWAERLHAFGNRILTELSNLRTGYRLTDMECGYKAMRVGVLRRIVGMLTEDRFGIEPQITAVLSRLGEPIEQAAISYSPRSVGEGKKIKWRDGWHAVRVVLRETGLRARANVRGSGVGGRGSGSNQETGTTDAHG